MGEMVNAIVLSMVLIPVGIALGYFLLKLQGGQEEEEA
jgi:cytochrome b6-f complex subunit 7